LGGEHRVVVAVDEVMRDAGMVGLLGEDFVENFACLLLVGIGPVRGWRGRQESEGIKNRGFAIVGIALSTCCISFSYDRARVRYSTLS
jgi:hypothetical protein